MRMTAITGQMTRRFRNGSGAHAIVLGHGHDHVLEENVLVSGFQCIVIIPVHFKLAIRVLVIILVGIPAKLEHRITDLANHWLLTH